MGVHASISSARALLLASVVALATASAASCGTDAVGVDACKQIEYARCEAAPTCPTTASVDVELCKDFYRDQCLHGIENTATSPSEEQVNGCVAAIQKLAACPKDKPITECLGAGALVAGVDAALLPCDVLVGTPDETGTARNGPQDLVACAFVAVPVSTVDAGAPGTGGQGGAAGSGGTGGSSATTGGAGGTGGGTGGAGGG